MEAKLEEQNREIDRLEHCFETQKDRTDFAQAEIGSVGTDKIAKFQKHYQ